MTDQLLVPAVLTAPTHPLILCSTSFLTQLKEVEAQVGNLKITDPQSAQHAADLLVRLTGAGKALDKQRLELNAPYAAQITAVNEAARTPTAKIESLKITLNTAQAAWSREQVRLQQEAEANRQAELKRLEAQAAKERADAEAKAKAIADASAKIREAEEKAGLPLVAPPTDDDWGDEVISEEPPQPTETEKAIAAVKYAPVVAPVKAAGVREVTTLVPFVTDVNLLPDLFVRKEANLAAIRASLCSGYQRGNPIPVCPGVRFEVQTNVVSTGRNTF